MPDKNPSQKNIVHGSITAGGNVHIGDIIYQVERDFQSGSILFLRLDKQDDGNYLANLSIKSKQSPQGTLATTGEQWCENIDLTIPPTLFETLQQLQTFRRGIDTQMRVTGAQDMNPSSVIALENQLSQLMFQTFFAGPIGKACADFIKLLENQRIEELLLAISTDEEAMINLPFEMALPLLFPAKLGEAKRSLVNSNFGLVRTKAESLNTFRMQGKHANAAPLKMLFITALPENLDERGKMLQIEEEQTRLIRAIGALEATGDQKPKIVIEFLDNASLQELDKALRARQHDIVHISGHGAYHKEEKKGVLYFENEDGDEEQVTGAGLAETLRHHACVKLLILSACETAIAGSEGGVTEQAAAYGLPSIVAMRFAVTDEGAKVFTTELYTQLAKGLSLTRALAYARQALHRDIVLRRETAPQILHIAEWFTPVVYQNQWVGPLIDKAQPYLLPDHFYPRSSFLKTRQSRLIGEGFIGRKRYLIKLRQAFRAGRHVCLHGLGGLGKTTLAEAFAHNYDNHSHTTIIFRGHQINEVHILTTLANRFAKARPELAEQVQQAMDNPEMPPQDKLQLLIDNYLQGRKTIMIFDNVEDVQTDEGGAYQRGIGSEPLREFLQHLCENTPANCHLLFTTRYKIENLAEVIEHLPLDKMGYAEQYRLLNYSKILRGIPLTDRDEVYQRLDGHPRGYEYLEALLKKDKTFHWAQVSQAEAEVFQNLLLAKVYERLTEQEQSVFQMAAVFTDRTPVTALAAVSGKAEEELVPILQALQDWSLCFWDKNHRFEVHRLTREWMVAHIIPAATMKEWAFLAGEYFGRQPTWGDEILAKDYFEMAETWEEFANTSFYIQNHYQLIGLYQQAFELNSAVLEKDVGEKSISHALFNQGAILKLFGQYDQALALYEQSLAVDKKTGNRQGEGATLNNISQIYSAKGEYDQALLYLKQSLKTQQQIGGREGEGEGATLNNIGQIHSAKGEYDKALQYFEQSLEIVQEIGDRKGESVALNNIGQIHQARGNYEEALRYAEMDLAICQQIADRRGEGITLNNISQIYSAKGEYHKALQYLEKSLEIRQQIGDVAGMATTLNNISRVYDAKGEYDKALQYLKQSLEINQQIGNAAGIATTLHNMGTLHFEQERYETAVQFLVQAHQIWQKLGSPNANATENYLDAIIERIGEARFQEIISSND